MRIDSTDLKILSLLQENARISFSSIAAEVHLSTTAVTRRIELMQERGIIRGFRTLISPQAGGKTVHGFIIGGVYSVMLYDLYRYVQTVPEVVRCETIICGGKEVILEFYCDNYDSLLKFYGSDIRKFLDSMTGYLVTDTPLKDVSIPLSSNG